MHALEYLYPMRTFLITSGTMEKPNVMTADWVTPLSLNPPLVGAAIAHKRYTKKLIDEYGEFVVSVPTIELLKDVWIAGTVSGANVNKAEKLSLTFVPSKKVKAPSIKECQANLECKVVNAVETGDHVLYVGEIVEVTHEDAFKDKPDVKNYKFILHVGFGNMFTTNSSEIFKA
ncbi:flavin reductase family protein [Archaeoglobus profundus]|uniref:Flavin reductase domain protein FMN-binding protein n=1 Tax=Archaeoglobus profundus (strain DSM 5631 / JCM 9629 / NBRC 100127 / Av18) TaxID=572546 RepID=D2RGA9_ARCPA|nr:flavin reductase family protein [Archaeoglobus profundus]ADB57334.1 flavin reductase domain protein FMN-binding protein [Archaeoglobus profundus DSM 5631]